MKYYEITFLRNNQVLRIDRTNNKANVEIYVNMWKRNIQKYKDAWNDGSTFQIMINNKEVYNA